MNDIDRDFREPAKYGFKEQGQTRDIVSEHLVVVDHAIQQFLEFKKKVSNLGDYEVAQKQIAEIAVRDCPLPQVQWVKDELQILKKISQNIVENADAIRDSEDDLVSFDLCIETLGLQHKYIEKKAHIEATVAAIKAQTKENEQASYKNLAIVLEQYGGLVLKGSSLSWLVNKNKLVPPYDNNPIQLSDYIYDIQVILENFTNTANVIGKLRGLFPRNKEAVAKLQAVIGEAVAAEEALNDITSSAIYLPSWQNTASMAAIQNKYQFIVRRTINEMCAVDTESSRFIDLYDGMHDLLSKGDIYSEYELATAERHKAMGIAIFGENPPAMATKLLNDLKPLSDHSFYLTHDKLIELAQAKVVDAWELAHKETLLKYRERIQLLEGGADKNDFSRMTSILNSVYAKREKDLKGEKDEKPDSLEYLEFFKQRFPVEAQLLSDEIAEMERKEKDKMIAVVTVNKDYKVGDSTFRLQEPIDISKTDYSVTKNVIERMIAVPRVEYYPLALGLLQKLKSATSYSGGRDSYVRLIMLALASKSQMDDKDLPENYMKIWGSFIDVHRSEGEISFLSNINNNRSRDFDQVLDERASFFRAIEENMGSFNHLLTESFNHRLEEYKKILEYVKKDTLIAETLLRHELSFVEQSQEAILYLTDIMVKNRMSQDKKCKKEVSSPQVSDLILQHPVITAQQKEVVARLNKDSSKIFSALSLQLLVLLANGESIEPSLEILQKYLDTCVEYSKSSRVQLVVENLIDLLSEQDLQELLSSATQAMKEDRIDFWLIELQKTFGVATEDILIPVITSELKTVYDGADAGEYSEIGEENWKNVMYAFIQVESDLGYLAKPSTEILGNVKELFKSEEVKAQCFQYVHEMWLSYLESGDEKEFPYELAEVTQFVRYHMGAGPLKYVTSLSNFAFALRESYVKKTTTDTTSRETFSSIGNLEKRFVEERWSQKEIADFYDISTDLLENAPSLFAQFLHLFEYLSKSSFVKFVKENYPLFQARVAIINVAAESNKEKRILIPRDLVSIRRELKEMVVQLQAGEDVATLLEGSKKTSIDDMKQRFQDAFGITRVPEEISREHIRTIQNNARYLANINEKTQGYKEKLALFLALKLSGKWDDFRRNQEINVSEFFLADSAQIAVLREYLEKREVLLQPIQDTLGIGQEDMAEFWQLLNTEDSLFSVMNVQSVDLKLQAILASFEELNDPDVYEKPLEKNMLPIYIKHGVATVNKAISMSFMQLNGKEISFKDENDKNQFEIVQEAVRAALVYSDREWNADSIKELQSETKMLSSIQKTYASIHERGIPVAITELQRALLPSQRIIDLFQKIGEDFNINSGAIALTQDVDYLENIIVKHGDKLSVEERKEVAEYLTTIREKIARLEAEYTTIKQRFSQFSQSMHADSPILQSRLAEINKVINQTNEEKEYTSTFSNDMNVVIENIRACLGCLQKEVNNDTNLTFGDPNKFFLMTKNSELESSMSDQIVLAEPVTHQDGTSEISLVFDRLYGIRSADIFMSHVALVWKRFQAIKKRFPESKISVFVTEAALSSAGVTKEVFFKKIEDLIGKHQALEVIDSTVNVLESAGSNPYIEFGGDSRAHGERSVSGVILRLPAG